MCRACILYALGLGLGLGIWLNTDRILFRFNVTQIQCQDHSTNYKSIKSYQTQPELLFIESCN